ncbi:MAG: hypothetical protein M1818_002986 [Claussenomyces sp. TS43310]|nr:MAG: hypothetical protein M1818_002986 [Claussenomyces sp. TS43310]
MEKDFGLEVLFPGYTSEVAKKEHVSLFILLCRLSNIMENVAIFQRNACFARDWSKTSASLTPQEVKYVAGFERELRSWRIQLDGAISINTGSRLRRSKRSKTPLVYILRIINSSLLAALYRPYLSRASSANLSLFGSPPLELVKESSFDVAENLNMLLGISRLEGIPSYLYHICEGFSKGSGLKAFLLSLQSRYQSAQFVSLLLDKAFSTFSQESVDKNEAAFFELVYYALQQPAYEQLYLQEGKGYSGPAEAALLDRVVNLIDLGLANDVRGLYTSETLCIDQPEANQLS